MEAIMAGVEMRESAMANGYVAANFWGWNHRGCGQSCHIGAVGHLEMGEGDSIGVGGGLSVHTHGT